MDRIQLKGKWFEEFLTEDVILKEIDRVAQELNDNYKDKDPLFVCVLNGAFMFAAELIGRFHSNCDVTFIRIQSYEGIQRGESMKEIQSMIESVKDRHVVIIEDIIDTGHTMHYLINKLRKEHPATVRIATLLFKPHALQIPVQPDYVVKAIPNDFIVGFGLDYNGHGRNLRTIYKVVTESLC